MPRRNRAAAAQLPGRRGRRPLQPQRLYPIVIFRVVSSTRSMWMRRGFSKSSSSAQFSLHSQATTAPCRGSRRIRRRPGRPRCGCGINQNAQRAAGRGNSSRWQTSGWTPGRCSPAPRPALAERGLARAQTARERDQRPGRQRFGKLTANGDGFLPRMGHKFLHKQAPCFGPHKARPHTYIL